MLRWAITFLVIALVAAVLGFGGVAGVATDAARIVFFAFLIMFALAMVFGRKAPVV